MAKVGRIRQALRQILKDNCKGIELFGFRLLFIDHVYSNLYAEATKEFTDRWYLIYYISILCVLIGRGYGLKNRNDKFLFLGLFCYFLIMFQYQISIWLGVSPPISSIVSWEYMKVCFVVLGVVLLVYWFGSKGNSK